MTDTPQDERDVAAEAPSMAEEGNDEVRLVVSPLLVTFRQRVNTAAPAWIRRI